jgi:PAS domain S-box-containing protein
MGDMEIKQMAADFEASSSPAAKPRRSQLRRVDAGSEHSSKSPSAILDVLGVLDSLPFYVLLVDSDHRIIMANSAVKNQLGKKPEDIIGGYCPKIIHGIDEPWYACPLEEAAEKGVGIEREVFDKESRRWISSAIYPIDVYLQGGKRVFFHMVTDITKRKQLERRLKTSHKQLRRISANLESVREEERKQVAREVHDELGQTLTALKIDLSWLAKRLPEEQELLHQKTQAMNTLVDEAIQTVKRVITELRPGILDDLGLEAAIEWQAQEFEKLTEIKCELSTGSNEVALDTDRSIAVFRIFQEALTNVARHASATKVKARLGEEQGKIVLKIRDNGSGIGKNQLYNPKAFGLIGMRERARLSGGLLKIKGVAGKGTTVTLIIPRKKGVA